MGQSEDIGLEQDEESDSDDTLCPVADSEIKDEEFNKEDKERLSGLDEGAYVEGDPVSICLCPCGVLEVLRLVLYLREELDRVLVR